MEEWKQVSFSDESNIEVINEKNKVLLKRFKFGKYSNCFVGPWWHGGDGKDDI